MKVSLYLALPVVAIAAASCKPRQPSAEYLAVCEGPPIRGDTARRQKAMEDGLEIDPYHDCITKRSMVMIAEERRKWEAANTPEARAAQAAELERRNAEAKARMEAAAKEQAEARAERERQWAEEESRPVRAVEINTAPEHELATVQGMGADAAGQIVAERAKGPFKDWADVVHRVAALSAAETAARASGFGLTVNGRSLQGVEPSSDMARYVRGKWRRRAES